MVDESTRIYHQIIFHAPTTQYSLKKIKKSFKFWSSKSKISIFTLADASNLTIWSINTGNHKINGHIFTLFSMVQVENMLGKAPYYKKLISGQHQ